MPKAPTELGARLRRARPQSMTQVEAAQAIGVSRRTLQRWESGERAPDVAELWRLCQVYGVKMADLLREE